MSKHKPIKKIVIIGSAVGGIAVAVAVMVFIFGFGFDIVQQTTSGAPFTIPFPELEKGEKIPSKETIENAVQNHIPIEDIPNIPTISEKELQAIEEVMNTTETSNDPIPVQIINQIIPPKTLKLEANIIKTDSNSKTYTEKLSFDIKPLSLFVEDTSNIDFRTGFAEISMNVVADPASQLTATGFFDVLINGESILTQKIKLDADGVTDSDGKIDLKLQGISNSYTFDFNNNFDKFPNERTSKLSFVLDSLEISANEKSYGLTNQEIFSMDIFRDDAKILVTDSTGNQVRAYPQDYILTITSDPTSIYTKVYSFESCPTTFANYLKSTTLSATKPAISLNTISVIDDQTGLQVSAGGGTGTVLNVKLFRNHNYTIDHQLIDKPRSLDPFKISTPKSQVNYQYNVWTEMTYTSSPYTFKSGLCTTTWTTVGSVAGSEFVTSNFPK